MNDKFAIKDRMATLSLIGLGVFMDIRGIYWFTSQSDVISESDFYLTLHEVMPIWIWGLLIIASGSCLIISSLMFGRRSVSNISDYFMLIGGAGGAIIHFLLASAGMYNTINWITPAQFITLTAWLGFIGFLGGVSVYGRK